MYKLDYNKLDFPNEKIKYQDIKSTEDSESSGNICPPKKSIIYAFLPSFM